MSVENQVRVTAGGLVAGSVLLGYFAHPAFYAIAGALGAGLVVSGVTNTCALANGLAKMPWNRSAYSKV
jgi:hypothetical protein